MGDPAAGRVAHDAVMRTQFAAVTAAMRDDSPAVRAAAVEGACGILGKFWELVPARTAKGLLARLVGECARDAASTAVRAAVVKGLGFVLDNVLSHEAMRQVLPALAPLLHDRSDKVRAEMARLLRAVQGLRSFALTDVVDSEQVLARLALDAAVPEVASELSGLLVPSLFPEDASVQELLSRTVKCMKTHAAAGLAFYANLHHHVSSVRVCRLVLVVHKAIKKACHDSAAAARRQESGSLGALAGAGEAARAGSKRGRGEDGEEDEDMEDEGIQANGGGSSRRGKLRADNTMLMAALLRVAHVAWASISDEVLEKQTGESDSMGKARRKLLEAWGGRFLGAAARAMLGADALTCPAMASSGSNSDGRNPPAWDATRSAVLASLLGIAGLLPETGAGSKDGESEGTS